MFEGIVVSLLNRLIGKYVDNLDTKQLSISVWKGDVVLQNLRLKKDALVQLDLPIDVYEGYLGELVLNFSWTDFKNTPVNLNIKNVLLLAVPRAETDYDEELEEIQLQNSKLEKIREMELQEIELAENNVKQETYMTQLMAKIIDNLQISISNIHIRYEDQKSNPKIPFSIGLTISQLMACSSNEEWEKEFVKESNTTYKLLSLEGLSLYWNTNSELYSNKTSYDFFKMMEIDLESAIQFILKPVSGRGKIFMNKNNDFNRMMTKIDILLDEFGIIIDEDQYQNIWLLIDNFSNYQKSEKYRKFRPPKSTTPKTHPLEWFRYLGNCVLYEIHEKNYKSSWEYFKSRRDDRRLYIKLYQQVLLGTANPSVQEELKELERKLSFDDIKYYRNLTKSILKTNTTVKPKVQPQNVQRRSWLTSWWNKEENESKEENQIVTDEDLKLIYQAIDFDPNFELRKEDLPPELIMLNLIFNLKRGSLTFVQQPHSKNPITILYSNIDDCILDFVKRPTSFKANVKISDFILKDSMDNHSKFSELIKAKNTKNIIIEGNEKSENDSTFLDVIFENNPFDQNIDYSLNVQMKPLEVNYNYEIIDNLIKFVTRPTIQPQTLIKVKNVAETTFEKIKSQTRAGLDYLLMTRKVFDLKIDIEAPIFLFRQSNTTDFLIVDAGNLIIKSKMIDKEKKEYLQSKIGQKLTPAEEKTLNSLLYDKFTIFLNSVQVLAGNSLEKYEKDVLANSTLSHYDIIEKTNIALIMENCVLPKVNTDSPQCKIDGTLPKLVLNITDEKYIIFMNTISNVLSLFGGGNISQNENNALYKKSFFDLLTDDNFTIVEDDEFFDAKEEDNSNARSEIDLFSISDLEFNFNIKEVNAKVGKYNKNTDTDDFIANMVLLNTKFFLVKRLFDTKIISQIENIFVEDNAQELNSEFRKILLASEPDNYSPISREKPLISIEYFDIDKNSPEYFTKYRGIERRIDFKLAALDLFISNRNIMEIYDFITKTFVNNDNNNNSNSSLNINITNDNKNNNKENQDEITHALESLQENNINTTLITVNMKAVNLILNNGKFRIATCNVNTGVIEIYTQQETLYVTGQLEDISVVDNVKRVENGRHYYQLLRTKGNKALDFKFIKSDPFDKENYPGYDMKLFLRADSVEYTHLYPLIDDLYEYINEMRELYETAKDKAIQSASQIKENTSKIIADIEIQTPIIKFPKGSLQSKDHLVVYLGKINVKNKPLNNSLDTIVNNKSLDNQNFIPNKFIIDISSMKAFSHYYFGEKEQILQILKDFNLNLYITLADLIRDDDIPRIKIISTGFNSDINIQLTEKQYLHILELYHSIFRSDDNNLPVNNSNSNNTYINNEDNLIKSISHSNLNLNPTMNSDLLINRSYIKSELMNNKSNSYKKTFYMVLEIPSIKLETFIGDANGVENLEEIGHSSLQIIKPHVNVMMSNDNEVNVDVSVKSFTMNDICKNHKCVFREIIPSQTLDKNDTNFANIYFQRDNNKNSSLMVDINYPKIIFALNTLFELKDFFFNPLNIPVSSIHENVLKSINSETKIEKEDENSNNNILTEDEMFIYNVRPKDKMKLIVTVNNPEIILLENHELHNTEAVVLSANKVIVDDYNITKLFVEEIGAFLCVFEEREDTSLRLISNFNINISLNNQTPSPDHLFKEILLDLSFLELRISYLDILLFEKIYNEIMNYLNDTSENEKNAVVVNNHENQKAVDLIMKHEALTLHCNGIHIILIDDLKGLHLQTIDGKIGEFTFNLNNWSSSLIAQTCLPIEMNFFNIKSSHWEPIIEPWEFNVNVTRNNANSEFNYELRTKDKLNINICYDTINSLINTYSKFSNQKGRDLQSRRIETYPYILRNRTGSDITIWNEDKDENKEILKEIPNNCDLKYKFTDWREMREREKVVENKLNIQINTSTWETIRSIPVDQEKTISYLLRPFVNEIIYILVVDIKVIDNIKYVTFRSSSILKNRTNLNLDILIMGNKITQYSINPMEDFYIPIMDTYNGKIKIKPKDEKDRSYNWSEEAFIWRNFRNANTFYLNCKSNKNLFYFKIYNETSKNKLQEHLNMTYSVVPPLEIENLLPYSLKFCVLSESRGSEVCESCQSYIYSGKSYSIYELSTNNALGLSINIFDIDFQQKETSIITDNKYNKYGSVDKYITLYNSDGYELKLLLCYTNQKTGTKRVSIMCPYIIYNKTNLDVQVITRKIINTNTQSNNLHLRKSRKGKLIPNLFSFNNQFNALSNRALLKVPNSELSKPISFEAVGTSYNVQIPIVGSNTVELGINVTEGQGKYHNVKVITVSPRYVIVNKLDVKMKIKQIESRIEYDLGRNSSISLDYFKDKLDKNISFKLLNDEDEWTSPINIDNIGTYYLKFTKYNISHEELIKVNIVLHDATVYISLTKSVIWPIRIVNEYNSDVIIYQKNAKRKYKVLTNYSISYALDDPCDQSKIIMMEIHNMKFEINVLDIKQITPIEIDGKRGSVIIQKSYEGPILIIKIQELNTLNKRVSKIEKVKNDKKFNLSVAFSDIGISLINKDVEEFLYLSLKQIELILKEDEKLQKGKLIVEYLQIDNQLYNAMEEVILHPTTKLDFDNKQKERPPIIQVSFSKNKSLKYGVNYFEYFDSLIQEFSLKLDEELLHSLIEFLNFSSLQGNNENNDLLIKEDSNIDNPIFNDSNKLYFEVFQLQPIKANISFSQIDRMESDVSDSSLEYNRNSGTNIFTYLTDVLTMTIGNIHNAPLDLHALILEHPTVDANLLLDLIKTHYSQEIIGQLHKILGSADLIGNPVNLFNSISSGVYDIFYEPIQGFISDRPQDIGIGIATGTGKFVLKTISGFSSSVSQISGSIGKGLSKATMDQKFVYQRQMSSRNKPKHALGGISTGATQLGKSVASAISGVVEQPVSGLQKDGFGGFIKGVGKGLVGAFTKPVVGVFDLASNVTEGIKNTTSIDELEYSRIRYPRHIGNNKILKVYNKKEARGQYIKNRLNNGKYAYEDYVTHIELSEEGQVLIQTEQRLLHINANYNRLISEITLDELNSIEIMVNIIIIKYRKRNNPSLLDKRVYIKEQKESKEFVEKVNEVLSLYKYEKLRLIK